jgi:hypothetical protein
MRISKVYLGYGLVVLALLGWAEYRGWSFTRVNEERDPTPHSVRDNPGASRPIYGTSGRYVGGK